VNATEVVVEVVERDRKSVVLKLLREGVCEARKAADAHSHGEILALDKACIDVARVRVSFDATLYGARANGRAVKSLECGANPIGSPLISNY
jgi:hypothetical protein